MWGRSEFDGQQQSFGEFALQYVAIPWLVVGDLNVPPTQWQDHHLLSILRADLVSSVQPTMVNGNELDYVNSSRDLSQFLEIHVTLGGPLEG